MKTRCLPLPGIDGGDPPASWDDALHHCSRKPAKRSVLEALRSIAGSRAETCPSNRTILKQIVELRLQPMSERQLQRHLDELEWVERLIARSVDNRTKSRRRITFAFLHAMGGDHRHPRMAITDTQGWRSPTPKGGDHRHPSIPQVQSVSEPAPPPVSPLNSTLREEEKTLTLPPPPEKTTEPRRVATVHSVKDRWARLQACAPEESPAPAPAAPRAAPPTIAPAHVETVDLIRRLESPCGPEAVEAAAEQIAGFLGDERSLDWYRQVCRRVQEGQASAKTVISAFRQARSETARIPGAVFTGFLREHDPGAFAPSRKNPAPGATRQCPPGAGDPRPARSGPSRSTVHGS